MQYHTLNYLHSTGLIPLIIVLGVSLLIHKQVVLRTLRISSIKGNIGLCVLT